MLSLGTVAHALAVDAPADLPNLDRPPPFVLSPLPPRPPGKQNIFGNTLRLLWLNNNLVCVARH